MLERLGRLTAEEERKATQSLIQARVIGEGLIAIGLATTIIVWLLPPKPFKWVFYLAGIILIFAGAIRIDLVTRPHRHLQWMKKKAKAKLGLERDRPKHEL